MNQDVAGTLKSKKIYLTLLNGTGYVFNVHDYMQLRQNHRIIGSLVGTCSTRGWSANANTLPAELTRCETQLLVEKEIAVLLSKSISLLRDVNEEEKETYQKTLQQNILAQKEALKMGKMRNSMKKIDWIIAGKRRKLLKEGVPENSISLNQEDVLKEIEESIVFDEKNALIQIHCEHPLPHEGIIVPFPSDNSLKYRVFRDLWERGYYLTCGEAFGADFLIYPGDPLLYHASHIVILLHSSKISPLDFITKVRLSVIVNKICVFAYLKESEVGGEIHYQTAIWSGNKTKEKKNILEKCSLPEALTSFKHF